MNFSVKEPTNAELVPCPHMRSVISPLADGSLHGLMLWYAQQHTRGCERCGEALAAMIALRNQLSALATPTDLTDTERDRLSETNRKRLLAMLDAVDTAPDLRSVQTK